MRYLIDPHLLDPDIVRIIDYLRYLFIGVGGVMLFSIFYFIIRTNTLEEKYFKDILEFAKSSPYREIKVTEDWNKIKKKAKSEDESNRKVAIIKADDILSSVLSEMGYNGDDLESSIDKAGKEILPNKEDLRRAHKIRRDMIYDPNYLLSEDKAEELISIYEQTLDDLDLI